MLIPVLLLVQAAAQPPRPPQRDVPDPGVKRSLFFPLSVDLSDDEREERQERQERAKRQVRKP